MKNNIWETDFLSNKQTRKEKKENDIKGWSKLFVYFFPLIIIYRTGGKLLKQQQQKHLSYDDNQNLYLQRFFF